MWYHDPVPVYTATIPSAYRVASVRPDIRCTFAAMRQCDALFGHGTHHADECRAGARDAHLLDYAFGRSEAYRAGRTATLVCPPSFDEAYPYTRRHHAHLHDPRGAWPCRRC